MKKHEKQKAIGKKVASYSALAASFLAIDAGLQAQSLTAVCTTGADIGIPSIAPGDPSPGNVGFDLDGDGVTDFGISNQTAAGIGPGGQGIIAAQGGSYVGAAGYLGFGTNPNGNQIQGFLAGAYGYPAALGTATAVSAGAMLGSTQRGDMFWVNGYPSSQWAPGTTAWLGARVLLDCDGDGVLTNDTHVFAAIELTVTNDGSGLITVGEVLYDCNGADITVAGVQAACVPTMGQWAQMCLALFFVSTGLVYIRREEELPAPIEA